MGATSYWSPAADTRLGQAADDGRGADWVMAKLADEVGTPCES
jgi:hypothetical protein